MQRDEELSVRPGTQAGWTLPLMGTERCEGFGHELQPVFAWGNGLLIGYCNRCEARVEIPWFRGGTAAVLATAMAVEAVGLRRPAASVAGDLEQVQGLLEEDLARLLKALKAVAHARATVESRRIN